MGKRRAPPARGIKSQDFVASVGLSPNHNAFVGLEDDIDGDLSLGTKIRSFAPVRDDTSVEILNCGEAIMRSILHVLDEATTEICMSWFDFVHDLPAVRSESLGANAWSNESGTLPSLLRQKASKGVKVYIMLWNSLDLVMPTAPLVEHAIRNLGKLHPNITVVSHPGLNVWTHTHHQKFVVVDRRVAIVGGLDWAFKRFDTPAHPLFDPKSSVHPGVDLFSDEVNGPPYKRNVALYFQDKQKDVIANRSEVAAKPWQDVAVWMKGDAAADVALNFIQRWQWALQDTVEVFGDGLRNDMPEIPMQIRFLRRPNLDAEAVDDKTRLEVCPRRRLSTRNANVKLFGHSANGRVGSVHRRSLTMRRGYLRFQKPRTTSTSRVSISLAIWARVLLTTVSLKPSYFELYMQSRKDGHFASTASFQPQSRLNPWHITPEEH